MSKSEMKHADVAAVMDSALDTPGCKYMMALGMTLMMASSVESIMKNLLSKHTAITDRLKIIDKIDDDEARKTEMETVAKMQAEFEDYVEKNKAKVAKYFNVIDLDKKDSSDSDDAQA